MLVSQFNDVRRFLGRLDSGQDLAAGFKTVCRENGVSSGWLQATAVIRNPTVSPLRPDGKGVGDPVALDGVAFCPSITGNVSLSDGGLDLRLYATCHRPAEPSAPPVLGLLRGGEVLQCEFILMACDGISLIREDDDPKGFAPWMQLQPGPMSPAFQAAAAKATAAAATAAAAAALRDEEMPAAARTTLQGEAAGTPAQPPLLRQPIDEDESSELNILDMGIGDYVDHPRFGKCRIVHEPQDEKVTIRLDTGKHVDLHLGVMRVLPPRQIGSRKVFQIEMRKRV